MKRFALATAAALTLVGPLATTAAAQSYGRSDNRADDGGRGWDRSADRDYGYRGDDNEGRRDNRRASDDDRRGGDRGRHHRRHQQWDHQRHNGYTYQGRWNYGPPPAGYQDRDSYQSGYHAWRRGERLPSYYRDSYRTVNYRREHLRSPPRGYHYVEDDRGDYLLVGVATGIILSVILSNQ